MSGVQDSIKQLGESINTVTLAVARLEVSTLAMKERFEESNEVSKEVVGSIQAQVKSLTEGLTRIVDKKNEEHEALRMAIYKIGTVVTIVVTVLTTIGKEALAFFFHR